MQYYIKGRYYSFQRRKKSMGIVLNLQLSVFTNYRIEPNANNISNLMKKINLLGVKEFLPNITTGQTIDLVNGKIDTISNLAFVTADRSGQIMCQNDRIDCIFNFNQENECVFETEIQGLENIIELIMTEYDIMSNRLAFNVNFLGDSYSNYLQDTNFGQNIISSLDFYNNKTLKEWSTRENVWHPIMISGQEEMLNVITELSMVISNQEDEKRLLCHMDINTIPENSRYRFNAEKLREFVSGAQAIAIGIKTNFEGLSNNAE